MRAGRAFGATFLFVWAALVPGPAGAAGDRRVAVISVEPSNPIRQEASNRVRGELIAAGFQIVPVTVAIPASPRVLVEQLDVPGGALLAAFAIIDSPGRADVWVSDRVHDRTVVRSVSTEAESHDRAIAVMAFSAVELLRTSLAEAWTSPAAPVTTTPTVGATNPAPTDETSAPPTTTSSFAAFAQARVIPRANALLWGGGVRLALPLSSPFELALDIDGGAGSVETSFARTSMLMASGAAKLAWLSGAAGLETRVELGLRVGVLHLSPRLNDQRIYGPDDAIGPWAGPCVAGLAGFALAGLQAAVGVEGGWAFVSSRGTFPDQQSPPLRTSGAWIGVRLSLGWPS